MQAGLTSELAQRFAMLTYSDVNSKTSSTCRTLFMKSIWVRALAQGALLRKSLNLHHGAQSQLCVKRNVIFALPPASMLRCFVTRRF